MEQADDPDETSEEEMNEEEEDAWTFFFFSLMNLITLLLNIYGYHLLLSESVCVFKVIQTTIYDICCFSYFSTMTVKQELVMVPKKVTL